jgi:hypothetical protein
VSTKPAADQRDEEIEALRDRVATLEHELAEQTRRTARVVAEAQEKLYWIERLGIDLERVMRVRGAQRLLSLAGSLRHRARKRKRLGAG